MAEFTPTIFIWTRGTAIEVKVGEVWEPARFLTYNHDGSQVFAVWRDAKTWVDREYTREAPAA